MPSTWQRKEGTETPSPSYAQMLIHSLQVIIYFIAALHGATDAVLMTDPLHNAARFLWFRRYAGSGERKRTLPANASQSTASITPAIMRFHHQLPHVLELSPELSSIESWSFCHRKPCWAVCSLDAWVTCPRVDYVRSLTCIPKALDNLLADHLHGVWLLVGQSTDLTAWRRSFLQSDKQTK